MKDLDVMRMAQTILDAAKQHLRTYGWIQNSFGRLEKSCCLEGAVCVGAFLVSGVKDKLPASAEPGDQSALDLVNLISEVAGMLETVSSDAGVTSHAAARLHLVLAARTYVIKLLADIVPIDHGTGYLSRITRWNDMPDRTYEQIDFLIDKAFAIITQDIASERLKELT